MIKWIFAKRRLYFISSILTMGLSVATIITLCVNINYIEPNKYAQMIVILLNSMTLGGKAILVSSKLIYEYRNYKEKDKELSNRAKSFKETINEEL